VVSGKGGTGKTTVAAALAVVAARSGRRVLLAETEGREETSVSRLLGLPLPGFEERLTPWGFSLLSITPREALLEYLWLFLRMRSLSRTLARSNVMEVVTDGVPGFRDAMVAGKLYELTGLRDVRGDPGRSPFDQVVVDAPPTGQLLGFLSAPRAYGEIIRAGRAHRQLVAIDRLVREQSRVVLVSVPEEMAVAETLETADALQAAGFPRPVIVANRMRPTVFPKGAGAAGSRLSSGSVAAILREWGVDASDVEAAELLAVARDEEARVRTERRWLVQLRGAAPVIELPLVATASFGRDEVLALAGAFDAEGGR
jgi:anion-transporting  ArsA/GET3 family ATPase